jgi:hypothetical protein
VQYGQIPVKWDSCVIWNKWRLIRGEELFNIAEDRAQEKNIASARKEIVAKMRAHYEKWWAAVEPGLKSYAAITVGSEKENPTVLSCSDWQDIYCDNVGHVSNAAGGPKGGPWNILVDRAGTYEIELFRWPPHLALPLTAARPVQKMTAGELPAGKALSIAAAQIQIAGQSLKAKPITPDAPSIKTTVKLQASQKTQLHAWFQNQAGEDIAGAFYAKIHRLLT